MLTIIGDILNWLAAGLLFPLCLTPLAILFSKGSAVRGSIIWLVSAAGISASVLLFAHFAVDLTAPPMSNKHFVFFGALLALTMIANILGGPKALNDRLIPFIKWIVTKTGRLAMWFVILMALIQFGVVILRYVFGVNSILMQESVTYLHGGVFLLAAGYALLTDDHVRVDIFYREASERRKAVVDIAGTYLFLFPFCFVLLWAGGDYVANAWAVREGSTEQSGIQGVYLLKTLIPIFAMLLTLAGIARASDATKTLRESEAA